MRRLLVIVVLIGVAVSGSALGMSESDKDRYRKELKKWVGEYSLALAIDANGFWAWKGARDPGGAKINALAACKEHSKRPNTCKIVDVDGKSAFIKQWGSSSSSSTDSEWVWCATASSVRYVKESSCSASWRNGKSYLTEQKAKAAHQHLKVVANRSVKLPRRDQRDQSSTQLVGVWKTGSGSEPRAQPRHSTSPLRLGPWPCIFMPGSLDIA